MPDEREGPVNQVTHRPRAAGSKDIVAILGTVVSERAVGLSRVAYLDLAQNANDAVHELGREAPISTRVQIAHTQRWVVGRDLPRASAQPAHMIGDFACQELSRPQARFMVEQDTARNAQPE